MCKLTEQIVSGVGNNQPESIEKFTKATTEFVNECVESFITKGINCRTLYHKVNTGRKHLQRARMDVVSRVFAILEERITEELTDINEQYHILSHEVVTETGKIDDPNWVSVEYWVTISLLPKNDDESLV